jgi:15-cis-phytoene synthase
MSVRMPAEAGSTCLWKLWSVFTCPKTTCCDILRSKLDERTVRLLQFEIERAYHLYEEAWPGIGFLAKKARFSVAVAADVYRGILGKIISNGYNVFTKRAFLSRHEKLFRLPLIWLRVQRGTLPLSG